jgi:hypothetical protein
LVEASQPFDTEEEKLSPSAQYRHGVAFNTDEQRLAAEDTIDLDHNIYEIELCPPRLFIQRKILSTIFTQGGRVRKC